MRIFITGATGYIGFELAKRLRRDGHVIRALVRATSPEKAISELSELGVECFVGDVTDRYSMREGMSGADWVVHAAAELDFGVVTEQMRRVNVYGSENVASLAHKLGVGGLLALSSVAVFGGSASDGSVSSEDSPTVEPLPSLYSVTKREGERAIRVWAERGLRVQMVYPSLVYGPPAKRAGANGLLKMIAQGRLPALIAADRNASWIHVEDLVEALVRILERSGTDVEAPTVGSGRGCPPGRYLLTGDVARIGEVVLEVCGIAGVSPPRIRLPLALAKALGWILAPYFRWRGQSSPLLPAYLESLGRHWNFDDSKARQELDWRPRTLAEGLPATIEFLLGEVSYPIGREGP